MKLSEFDGEKGLEALADLIEPAVEIMTDSGFREALLTDSRIKAVKIALKNHAKAVITVMAVLNGKDPDGYKPSMLELPKMLLDILNDPDIIALFTSQAQKAE